MNYCLGAYDKEITLWWLSLICVGTGLFKSNPASLVSKCYDHSDSGQISNILHFFIWLLISAH
ncbi:MAG: hypothetical protein AB8V03_01010 [Francisella endosymbiont of Hyalomma asiaticum]